MINENDPRSLIGPVIPRQDIGVIREMWQDRGEYMPFAMCVARRHHGQWYAST
jgi:hypothetical protein